MDFGLGQVGRGIRMERRQRVLVVRVGLAVPQEQARARRTAQGEEYNEENHTILLESVTSRSQRVTSM